MKRKNKNKIVLTDDDISAILCALPLVMNADADTVEQTQLNRTCCEIAANKLMSKALKFSSNEIRVIFVAIGFALDYISGVKNEYLMQFEIDAEWKSELMKNLFTYNRLYPYFDKLSEIHENAAL